MRHQPAEQRLSRQLPLLQPPQVDLREPLASRGVAAAAAAVAVDGQRRESAAVRGVTLAAGVGGGNSEGRTGEPGGVAVGRLQALKALRTPLSGALAQGNRETKGIVG